MVRAKRAEALQLKCFTGDVPPAGVADEHRGRLRVPFGVCTLCDLASDNSESTLLGRIFGVLAMSCLALLMSDGWS